MDISTASDRDQILVLKVYPGASGLVMLDNWGKMYERYRLEALQISYHPAVGTTIDGFVVLGVDLESRNPVTTLKAAMVLNPGSSGPVYGPLTVTVPASQLMSRKLLYTKGLSEAPAEDSSCLSVVVAIPKSTQIRKVGYLSLRYSIYFEGPRGG